MHETETDSRPLVCVDLDGVLNVFDEWKGSEHFHPARPGAREFLESLRAAGFRIAVFTVRWHEWVRQWLEENNLSVLVDIVTDKKLPAHVYLDDRAVCFSGDFEDALKKIVGFRTHWQTEGEDGEKGHSSKEGS
ncbi:MAG: hypothetical protein AAGU11_23945 [Syntrophobacteraceae bacterium]